MGGPSGSICGIELQKKGFKTCILDKSVFPRTKLCGGLLTNKTIKLLEISCPHLEIEDYIMETAQVVDFYYDDKKISSMKTEFQFFFTDRKVFDNLLMNEYKKLGGTLIENMRIKPEQLNLNKNLINMNNNILKYNVLVGADGCNSIVAKKVGIKNINYFCLEGEVYRNIKQKKEFRIYFGQVKKGYGWCFPKKEFYSVGIGGDNSNKSISKEAAKFFYRNGWTKILNKKGAFIPSGKKSNLRRLKKNIILVGDAAGFIDPVTGEGIYYAILSGAKAAATIAICRANNIKNFTSKYIKSINPIRKDIRRATFFQNLLYNTIVLNKFMNYIKNHNSFAIFYLDNVMSTLKYNYSNFILHYFMNKVRWKEEITKS